MIERRKFIKSSLAAVGTGVAASALSSESPKRPAVSEEWDQVFDVVCVGSGAAACAAAVTAVDLGCNVVVLEKEAFFGGTTRKSSAVAWVPNNFALRSAEVNDAEEDCLRYMVRYAFPERYIAEDKYLGVTELEFQRLRNYYRNASKAIDRFMELGAASFVSFDLPDGEGPSPDYSPLLNENKTPRGRSVWPDPEINGGRGTGFIEGMIGWLREHGAECRLQHKVVDLLYEDERVSGVKCEVDGKTIRIAARKGVVLGSGGFAHSKEYVRRHLRFAYGSCAASGSTGDMLRVLQSNDVMMGDLSSAWRTQVVLEQTRTTSMIPIAVNIPPGDSMILVNRAGSRVVNEKKNYNDRTCVHYVWDALTSDYPNQLLFMIFDNRTLNLYRGRFPLPEHLDDVDYILKARDIPELEKMIADRLNNLEQEGIISFSLEKTFSQKLNDTITSFNEMARTGEDIEYERGKDRAEIQWLAHFSAPHPENKDPVMGPNPTMFPLDLSDGVFAILLAPGMLDTNAGPEINENAQILNSQGAPIPGLYGAGNCVASPSRETYYGAGGTVGPAIGFGYIAAVHAVNDSHEN